MKKITNAISKGLLTAAVAGLGLALLPGTANATIVNFTVAESPAVPGALPNTFVADKLNGGYQERVTPSGTTFAATLVVTWGQYQFNGAGIQPNGTQLVGIPCPLCGANQYGMYTLLQATGNFGGTGTLADPFTFNPTSVTSSTWLDPNINTLFTLPGFGLGGNPVTLANNGDDIQLTSGGTLDTSRSSGSLVNGTPAESSFQTVLIAPQLTPTGALYWPTLAQITLAAVANGDFDSANTLATQFLAGDVSLQFESVPEPVTLGLLGMGLLGVAARARRSAKATR